MGCVVAAAGGGEVDSDSCDMDESPPLGSPDQRVLAPTRRDEALILRRGKPLAKQRDQTRTLGSYASLAETANTLQPLRSFGPSEGVVGQPDREDDRERRA